MIALKSLPPRLFFLVGLLGRGCPTGVDKPSDGLAANPPCASWPAVRDRCHNGWPWAEVFVCIIGAIAGTGLTAGWRSSDAQKDQKGT